MSEKKSFVLYNDLIEVVKELPMEKRGELFTVILEFVNGENIEINDLLIKVVFAPIRQALIRDREKYESIVERNRENGKKGGRPAKPKEPSRFSGNPAKPKKADNDIDIDIDIDIDNDILSFHNQDPLPVQKATKDIASFFNITEMSNTKSYMAIGDFARCLFERGDLKDLAIQFNAYRKLKEANGFKHGWQKYIGTREEKYNNGAWCEKDWTKEKIEMSEDDKPKKLSYSIK